ncbi:YbaB/EbfC family nucleoid-associated protein [Chloroflexota bacterium]
MNRFMLRQAKELQEKLVKAQEELSNLTVEGSSGGGAVKVIINGEQKVQSVKISPEAIESEDIDLLEDLVMAAMNDALEKSKELAQERLGSLTGGLKIPGLG